MITISLIIGGIAVALTRYAGRTAIPSNESPTPAADAENAEDGGVSEGGDS